MMSQEQHFLPETSGLKHVVVKTVRKIYKKTNKTRYNGNENLIRTKFDVYLRYHKNQRKYTYGFKIMEPKQAFAAELV